MACEIPNNWATLEQEPAVIEPKASLIRIRFPVTGEKINSRSTHRMKNGTDLATKSISPYSAANLSSKFYILNQDSQRFLRLKKNLSLKKLNDYANCLQKGLKIWISNSKHTMAQFRLAWLTSKQRPLQRVYPKLTRDWQRNKESTGS